MMNNPKKHTDPARAQARRQQILDAAELCFARKGFHGASMAEISQTAAMSAGHIYNYFESKEAIIAAISQQKVEALFSHPDNTLQSQIDEHIRECHDVEHIALMFDIMGEALRNPKMAEIIQYYNNIAQKRFEEICAKKTNCPPGELTERVRILRSILFGISAFSVCNPKISDQEKHAMINVAIERLFNFEC